MRAAAQRITEAELQSVIVETARLLGWKAAYFRPARTKHGWATPVGADGKGWPDLALAHPATGRLLFAELKSDRGKPTAEQSEWLEGLGKVAERCPGVVAVYLWTPKDWPTEILEVLS